MPTRPEMEMISFTAAWEMVADSSSPDASLASRLSADSCRTSLPVENDETLSLSVPSWYWGAQPGAPITDMSWYVACCWQPCIFVGPMCTAKDVAGIGIQGSRQL